MIWAGILIPHFYWYDVRENRLLLDPNWITKKFPNQTTGIILVIRCRKRNSDQKAILLLLHTGREMLPQVVFVHLKPLYS